MKKLNMSYNVGGGLVLIFEPVHYNGKKVQVFKQIEMFKEYDKECLVSDLLK